MKYTPLIPVFALGTTALAALALTGCGAGNSNNPYVTPAQTTTTTTTATSEIVYVADAGNEDLVRKAKKSAVSHDTTYPGSGSGSGPALEAYTLSVTSGVPKVTLLSSVPAEYELTSIAIDPAHHYLFALSEPDGPEVDVYSLNSDGSIGSRVSGGYITTNISSSTHALTVASPAGANGADYVYVAGNAAGKLSGFVFSGGNLTALTLAASSSDASYTLATDPTGSYLYSGGGSGNPIITPYSIAPSTGLITPATQAVAGTAGGVIVVSDPNGQPYVYAYDQGAGILYAYQRGANGTLTLDGGYPHTTASGDDLAITPSGNALFLSNGSSNSNGDFGSVTEATINSNGSLNTPSTTTALLGSYFYSITVDATGSYVGTLDVDTDALVVYPLSGTALGTPQSIPLAGSINPIAAVFTPGIATAQVRVK